MNSYTALKNNIFQDQDFKIIPIRSEDRYIIMQWRNEQIEHLRQREILTAKAQDEYFTNVISKQFKEPKPTQILFSFLKSNKFIGYGGLVHIDYLNKNAEISFLTETKIDHVNFNLYWQKFIDLIKIVAFEELSLFKIYAYAFDVRPYLYETFRQIGFKEEARIRNVYIFKDKIYDGLIFSLFSNKFNFRLAKDQDLMTTFKWASDKEIRLFSKNKNPISIEDHTAWFNNVISQESEIYLIAMCCSLVTGSIRFSELSPNTMKISFLLDKQFQSLKLSKDFLKQGIQFLFKNHGNQNLKAEVHTENIASNKVFKSLGFHLNIKTGDFNHYKLKYEDWKF